MTNESIFATTVHLQNCQHNGNLPDVKQQLLRSATTQPTIAHLTQSCDLGTETHEMKCFRIGIELSHTSRKILSIIHNNRE